MRTNWTEINRNSDGTVKGCTAFEGYFRIIYGFGARIVPCLVLVKSE